MIPEDLYKRPSNNETWRQCFIPTAELDILRPTIETLPTVHVVREARGHHDAEIAVAESCLTWLSTLSISLRPESELSNDQTAPSEGEISVHGIATAKKRAVRSFMSLATEAILSGEHGHGLDRYYLQYTSNRGVLATLMWKILLRRILVRINPYT